jgi:hypothetical protein
MGKGRAPRKRGVVLPFVKQKNNLHKSLNINELRGRGPRAVVSP